MLCKGKYILCFKVICNSLIIPCSGILPPSPPRKICGIACTVTYKLAPNSRLDLRVRKIIRKIHRRTYNPLKQLINISLLQFHNSKFISRVERCDSLEFFAGSRGYLTRNEKIGILTEVDASLQWFDWNVDYLL